MDGAGLTQAVGPRHGLLQDGGVHAGLQQEHMVGCTQHDSSVTPRLCRYVLRDGQQLLHRDAAHGMTPSPCPSWQICHAVAYLALSF